MPEGVRPLDIHVITGTSDYLKGGRWIAIRDIAVHPDFQRDTNTADLALLHMSVPIAEAAVPPAGPAIALVRGEPLFVSGWGAAAEGGQKSRQLMGAVVAYVDNATCNAPESYAGRVQPSMLCAGEVFGGADACQGDSGGPLVARRQSGPVLVGVISFGVGCGRVTKYGVYMRVSAFRDWIERTLAER
jgi:secreted trypsin-like serine protease